ncbi:hypothetical protein BDB01DRAFT_137352 [Pilobolus umbonatus]|nr:hypothetical protein BDB01DRAFT_137352 [Pilobolus umbonatus]
MGSIMTKRRLLDVLGGITSTMRSTFIHNRQLARMRKNIMKGRRHLMINFIGVLPSERKQSIGTHLLQYVLNISDQTELPVFFEVWDGAYVRWLQRFGFTIEDQKTLSEKDSITIYCMVREPLSSQSPTTIKTHSLNHIDEGEADTFRP